MSEPEKKQFEVPKGIQCPRCKAAIENAESVTSDGQARFRKGLIVVCNECSVACVVGDSSLIPLSLDDIKKLHPMTQRQLLATCRAIAERVAQKN